MRGKHVKYILEEESLRVDGVGDAALMDSDHVFAPLEILRDANLSSLKSAMVSVYRNYDYNSDNDVIRDYPRFEVTWSQDSIADFDEEDSFTEPVSLVLMRDRSLLIEIDIFNGPLVRNDTDTWPEGQAVLEDWLSARSGRFVSLRPFDPSYRTFWVARFGIPLRNRTVADANEIGASALAVVEAYATGDLTIESILGLLKGGHAKSLIGIPESQVLEAKRSIHFGADKDKLELAKDVSALANATSGGVLVAGLATRQRLGRDVVSSIHPFEEAGQVRRVRSVLHRYIYPPIQNLQVVLVPAGPSYHSEEYLLAIAVPTQPRELKPFLVAGVVINEAVYGNFVGLFERREDEVTSLTAPSIQAGLSAGFALLRGERASAETSMTASNRQRIQRPDQ